MTHDVQFTDVHIPAKLTGEFVHVLKASSDRGGLTVVGAEIVNGGTAAFVAHFALENWGTAGTAIKTYADPSGGTVISQGTAGTAGTTSHAANQPGAAFVLVSDHEYLDQGEWLVLRKTGAGTIVDATLHVEYIMGRN